MYADLKPEMILSSLQYRVHHFISNNLYLFCFSDLSDVSFISSMFANK